MEVVNLNVTLGITLVLAKKLISLSSLLAANLEIQGPSPPLCNSNQQRQRALDTARTTLRAKQ